MLSKRSLHHHRGDAVARQVNNSRALLLALKVSTVVPSAVLSRMVPLPRWTGSLKVTTMLLPTATFAPPFAGLNAETVGAVVSVAGAPVCVVNE